jgi:acetyl esterase/lipase
MAQAGHIKAAGALALLLASGAAAAQSSEVVERITGSGGCEQVGPQQQVVDGARAVVYSATGKRDLKLHIIEQPAGSGPHPAALFFFGGSWRTGSVASLSEQARAFAAQGYVAVLADYRVKCRDGTTPIASTEDAQAAYAWLRTHAGELQVDPKRIVLAGGSAGGQLALATAQKAAAGEKPAALVLFNPAVDLVGPAPWYLKLLARGISPSVLPVADLPPVVAFHGQSDTTVPIQTVRDFCSRVRSAGRVCELHEYAGQKHSFFHSHQPLESGVSAYDDTLSKALAFVARTGVTQ